MGYLQGKTCYLTGPITAVEDDGVGWRKSITTSLEQFGIIVDDPTKNTVNGLGEVGTDKQKFKDMLAQGKIEEVKKEFYPIIRKDLRSVDKSDFLILHYDPAVPMMGTVHELVMAHLQRKPILMHIEKDKVKDINPWILVFIKNGCLFTQWQDMIVYLHGIDSGTFNTSHWTL